MWNYVFYTAYLNFKNKSDYNGNESYVMKKVKSVDISWYPIKRYFICNIKYRARGVLDDDEEESNNLLTDVNQVKDNVIILYNYIKR